MNENMIKETIRWKVCPVCDGSGWVEEYVVINDTTTLGGYKLDIHECNACNGTGKIDVEIIKEETKWIKEE